MSDRIAACLLLAVLLAAVAPATAARFAHTEAVRIEGYSDEAMEPFLSRDGRFLFFNTKNTPGANTNIHFAEAQGEGFVYRGVLQGTVSYDLDAVPTLSANGVFCFVSPRDYRRTLNSVFCGGFDGAKVTRTTAQSGLASERAGLLIFDVELSSDAQTMIFAEGSYSGGETPDAADLHIATLTPHGYRRVPESDRLLAKINTDALEYAPSLSADGLELFFTRLTGWPFARPKIYRAKRAGLDEPFGDPIEVMIDGFVEAPSIAADGTLYFHKRVGGHYQIWRQAP